MMVCRTRPNIGEEGVVAMEGFSTIEFSDRHCRSHNTSAGCCVESEAFFRSEASMLVEKTEFDADGEVKGILSRDISSPSCLKRVGVRVGDDSDFGDERTDWGVVPRDDDEVWISDDSLTTCWFSREFSASICLRRPMRNSFCSAMACFSPSSFSTSRRFRSLEVWAAARFRSTRSMRRCSFSSSVLARFLHQGLAARVFICCAVLSCQETYLK